LQEIARGDQSSLRLDFDRRPKLECRGGVIAADAGLPAWRELNEAVGLTGIAAAVRADERTAITMAAAAGSPACR
jgi:hypothetical protein